MKKDLYGIILTVNNVNVPYISGSLSFSEGTPEKKVRTQTGGSGTTERIASVDLTTEFAEIKFQMISDPTNVALVRNWVNNEFDNAISLADPFSTFRRFGSNAGISSKYEVSTGVDGVIDVAFQCDKLVG